MDAMKRGIWCAAIFSLLVTSAAALAASPPGPGSTAQPDRPGSREFLLTSAGGLGGGAGLGVIALPFSLAAYLFSGGDLNTVLVAEGACVGLGSGAGAFWSRRSLGRPARFLPALGLALIPPIGAGLVLHFANRGADISDPVVAACGAAVVLGSPVLAALGSGLCPRVDRDSARSRLRLVPGLGLTRRPEPGPAPAGSRVSAGCELAVSF
jgi:hypothetical protein